MKIQLLIDKNSWANKYIKNIKKDLVNFSNKILIFNNHKKLKNEYDVCIIFSYFTIISKRFLKKSRYNLVTHESDLPKGRGMSPITWDILKNKKKVVFCLIEANEKMDSGNIYYKKKVIIDETLIFDEIKKVQYKNSIFLIKKFLSFLKKNKSSPKSKKQVGKATYYKVRKPEHSRININKNLKSQFNLIRVSDFENYPAFFLFKNKKFIIKLIKVK